MNSCLCIVLAAALAAPAAPPQQEASFAALEARMHDHVEQGRYETLAYEAEAAFKRRDLTPAQRRQMAFFAVQGLHRTYEIVRQPAGLCKALALLRRVERQGRPGASDRGTAERLRAVTEGYLQATEVKDPCGRARATTPAAPGADSAPPAVAAAPAGDELLPVTLTTTPREAPRERTAAAPSASAPATVIAAPWAEGPAPPPALSRSAERPSTHRPTGFYVAGSVFMAAGIGFVGGMGKYLYDAKLDDDAIKDIVAKIRAEGRTKATAAESKAAQGYSQQHEFHTAYAAIAAGGAVVCFAAGIALLVGGARRARVAARPWGGPSSVGVTLGGRF